MTTTLRNPYGITPVTRVMTDNIDIRIIEFLPNRQIALCRSSGFNSFRWVRLSYSEDLKSVSDMFYTYRKPTNDRVVDTVLTEILKISRWGINEVKDGGISSWEDL